MRKLSTLPTEYDAITQAPFGWVGIYVQGMHVEVHFLTEAKPLKSQSNSQPNPQSQKILQQIEAYLQNPHKEINLPLMLRGTDFQRKVWNAISMIPLGETRTYAQIAAQVGSGPRAVANACGANHLPIIIPCHRVVAKKTIGGFMQGMANGIAIKQWLLHHEQAIQP